MDESRAPALSFAPDRRFTIAAGVGCATTAALAVLAGDAPGRVLAGIAAVVLLAYVVSDVVFSPRLTVSASGLRVRTPSARAALGWDEIEAVRADTRSHLGLRSTALEIDAGATLIVLTRRALGADPEEAAGLVNAFRPA